MCLDECTPYPATVSQTKESLALTIKWAQISKEARTSAEQTLYGIVQGGTFLSLRRQAVDQMVLLDFDGYALGGVSVGSLEK